MQMFYGRFFRAVKRVVRLIFPGKLIDASGIREDEPAVYVAHHQDMQGPYLSMLWSEKPMHAWALHMFLDWKSCYRHYSSYTFPERFGWPRFLAVPVAFVISVFVAALLKSGQAISVYRGSIRIKETFVDSMNALYAGESLAIFPDVDYTSQGDEMGEMYEGFLQLERLYYHNTGKHLAFVPMSASQRTKTLCVGAPVYFSGDMPFAQEKPVVAKRLADAINELALMDEPGTAKEECS